MKQRRNSNLFISVCKAVILFRIGLLPDGPGSRPTTIQFRSLVWGSRRRRLLRWIFLVRRFWFSDLLPDRRKAKNRAGQVLCCCGRQRYRYLKSVQGNNSGEVPLTGIDELLSKNRLVLPGDRDRRNHGSRKELSLC